MAKCDSYKGSVEVVSGLVPKNGRDFPILDAHYILVGDGDQRLDDYLRELLTGSSLNIGFSVEEGVLKVVSGGATSAQLSVSDRVLNITY